MLKTALGITMGFAWALATAAAPTHLVDEKPVRISKAYRGSVDYCIGQGAGGNMTFEVRIK